MRNYEDFVEDDPLDERGLLKDGHKIRVSMMTRDSLTPLQRAVLADRAAYDEAHAPLRVVDALGNDGLALHRPGARYLAAGSATADSAVLAVRQKLVSDAYNAMVDDMQNAWKTPGREIEVKQITGDARTDAYLAMVEDQVDAWKNLGKAR
jgi:hypothetical protein